MDWSNKHHETPRGAHGAYDKTERGRWSNLESDRCVGND